jgi:kynurenine formamidase
MKHHIDLTHLIEEGMPVWPGDPQPEVNQPMTLAKDMCTVQSIRFNCHLGTHLDAPSHFVEGGATVHEIPLETLIGRAIILDFTDRGKNDVITFDDLKMHEQRLSPGARVLIKTGWDKNFKPGSFFEGFPCLTLEAAQCLAARKIGLLGLDTPSPSPVEDPGQAIHKTLLEAGIVIVEAIKGVTSISQGECELMVLPPMFRGFSGSPCRVVATVED